MFPESFRRLLLSLVFLSAVGTSLHFLDTDSVPGAPHSISSKFVVSIRPYGGLGDRLRPLVLGFYLAALTDRSFDYN